MNQSGMFVLTGSTLSRTHSNAAHNHTHTIQTLTGYTSHRRSKKQARINMLRMCMHTFSLDRTVIWNAVCNLCAVLYIFRNVCYLQVVLFCIQFKMASEKFLTFYNGIKMPAIGYGTWRVSLSSTLVSCAKHWKLWFLFDLASEAISRHFRRKKTKIWPKKCIKSISIINCVNN